MNTTALAGHAVDAAQNDALDFERTPTEILDSAGPTMSVPDYAKIFGISRDSAYRLAVRDELGVRVLRLGRRMRIPTADVRRLLGESEGGDAA